MLKRGFDIAVSGIALLFLLPLLLVLAATVRLDSPGPALFWQTRVGRSFRPFQLLKLRSMRHGGPGMELTSGQDERITRVGRLLRDYKLDELPQLWYVFRGEMSLVGPRPEMPAFVEQFQAGYAEILQVRPGITDPASLRYRSEAEILGRAADPVTYYTEVILPDKIEISKRYIRNANFRTDMSVILLTMAVLFKK